MRIVLLLLSWIVACSAEGWSQARVFTNPLLPAGADPYSFYKDGYYYYTHTTGRNITIWKTANLADLPRAEKKVIFTPPPGTMYSRDLWAPEIHFIRGKWYVYFAADDGRNENHRMYVLENDSEDPFQGTWTLKGKVADPTDKWAIDGDVFRYRRKWYMIWSGWEGDTNGRQDIYIARLKNPWTIGSRRVRISSPKLDWERHGTLNDANNPAHVAVNEGPQALMKRKKLFIVYSASGCWTDHYSLGLLSFTGRRNLLDSAAWEKNTEPVFRQAPGIGVYAPGHNSFFKSPDGKEDWILYHANSRAGDGCGGKRSPRAQKFTWINGKPFFGEPVPEAVPIQIPAEKN
ncbi:MAG TPA: glycoside hydrolase family 43 protein [Chitinophagaceae bacterium]|nr:glycoside hydrolase family 43 protein [Chitinophagaceae bacterium]